MASKKVYVHFGEEFTCKVVVEESTPCSDILVRFLTAYDDHQQANGGPLLDYYGVFLLNTKKKQLQPKSKAMNLVSDGEDLYVEQDKEANTREKDCTNSGCRKTYTDLTNGQEACWHHPGMPIFHEGLKGWQCCSKRVVDFDEAMSLPGCTLGAHKSSAPALKSQVIKNKPVDPKYLPKSSENGVETFDLGGGAPKAASQGGIVPVSQQQNVIIEEPDDPMDLVIAVGTKCRHHGCNDTFAGDESRTETCVYHPGLAVFHEGSKYWTCCRPRCAEFEQFLKIQGCKTGRHKFGPKIGEEGSSDPLQVKCRYDYYQQGDTVIASIYSKNIDRAASSIEFQPQTLISKLKFKDGTHFYKDIALYGEIDPSKCKFEFLSTKAEITLIKATPIVWEALEPINEDTVVPS